MHPKITYTIWLKAPAYPPSKAPDKPVKKVCRVKGTGCIGITISAPIAVKAPNIDAYTMLRTGLEDGGFNANTSWQ